MDVGIWVWASEDFLQGLLVGLAYGAQIGRAIQQVVLPIAINKAMK